VIRRTGQGRSAIEGRPDHRGAGGPLCHSGLDRGIRFR
jgi:hypothetical protein